MAANNSSCERAYSSVLIVPTGVGASIGGFAGDALPVARAMASLCDNLVTHPNVSAIYNLSHIYVIIIVKHLNASIIVNDSLICSASTK